jgi:hypothetical protein
MYRNFHFLRSSECLIALYTILQVAVDQALGYPKHHDERALLSMKTPNNKSILHDSLLSNKTRGHYAYTCGVVVCLSRGRVYNIGSRIQRSSDKNTIYYLLLYPHTMPSSGTVDVCIY